MACCLTWPIRLELSQRCHVTAHAGRRLCRLCRLCRLRTDEERPKLERKTTSFWGLLPARSTILVAWRSFFPRRCDDALILLAAYFRSPQRMEPLRQSASGRLEVLQVYLAIAAMVQKPGILVPKAAGISGCSSPQLWYKGF